MYDIVTYFLLLGAVGSADQLPFWATSNQFGLMPDGNGALFLAGANSSFDESRTFQWKWGASLAANADYGDNKAEYKAMVDELYASIRVKNIPFNLVIGMKHQPMEFLAGSKMSDTFHLLGTMSTTGGHIAWSGNSRTLPGYSINLEPWAIPGTKEHLWIYGTFGDYKTLDTRYCKGALIHSTKAFLRVDFAKHFSFHFGLDHYAVWGGDDATVKPTFLNYLRMITGRPAGSDGTRMDQLNVIGDHGGGELIKLEYRDEKYYAVAQHDIPYSDGSGMGFQNFPDGINTLYFGWKEKDRWISDLIFEYAYTRYQSGSEHHEIIVEGQKSKGPKSTGMDDYFNNAEYKDGWTYFGRMIGCPQFFTVEKSPEGYTLGIRNNRFTSHHIAVAGKLFRKAPYKLMLTQSMNYGTYRSPYAGESAAQKPWGTVKETGLLQFSAGFSGEIPLSINNFHGFSIIYGIYADWGEVFKNRYGASVGVNVIL